MKVITVIFVLIFIFGVQFSCNSRNTTNNEITEIFSVDSKVELLFFYKKDSSKQERDYFYENVLMKQVAGGYWTRDGVKSVFGIDRNGYEGFGIAFSPEATKEQREDVKKRLKESPLIHKVFENVVPNEIKDL